MGISKATLARSKYVLEVVCLSDEVDTVYRCRSFGGEQLTKTATSSALADQQEALNLGWSMTEIRERRSKIVGHGSGPENPCLCCSTDISLSESTGFPYGSSTSRSMESHHDEVPNIARTGHHR